MPIVGIVTSLVKRLVGTDLFYLGSYSSSFGLSYTNLERPFSYTESTQVATVATRHRVSVDNFFGLARRLQSLHDYNRTQYKYTHTDLGRLTPYGRSPWPSLPTCSIFLQTNHQHSPRLKPNNKGILNLLQISVRLSLSYSLPWRHSRSW